MRKSTFLTLGVILGFVFLMSLCDSGRDRSYDDPDERIPVPRARGVRDWGDKKWKQLNRFGNGE